MVERETFRSARWRYAFISGLLASASALPVMAATDTATADAAAQGSGAAVQEVIVTATKREENLQSVPISVQALTPAILAQHQVNSSDDYIKLLPSVSFQSFGPGQSEMLLPWHHQRRRRPARGLRAGDGHLCRRSAADHHRQRC